jgi:hypothetical protein
LCFHLNQSWISFLYLKYPKKCATKSCPFYFTGNIFVSSSSKNLIIPTLDSKIIYSLWFWCPSVILIELSECENVLYVGRIFCWIETRVQRAPPEAAKSKSRDTQRVKIAPVAPTETHIIYSSYCYFYTEWRAISRDLFANAPVRAVTKCSLCHSFWVAIN